MANLTPQDHSSLDKFSLNFEFDKTWHQAKKHVRKDPATATRIAKIHN